MEKYIYFLNIKISDLDSDVYFTLHFKFKIKHYLKERKKNVHSGKE